MTEEDKEERTGDAGIEARLRRVEVKVNRIRWVGLIAFGGALFAISLPFWPDWSGFIVAGIGLVLAAAATLLYLQPWQKG